MSIAISSSTSTPAPVACSCRGKSAAASGGLLWFAGVSLLAFGGPAVTARFADVGARVSEATVAVVRASQWLSGHAMITVAALATIVIVTLVIAAVSRRVRAVGTLFLLSGMAAWVFLAVTFLWPAFAVGRASP